MFSLKDKKGLIQTIILMFFILTFSHSNSMISKKYIDILESNIYLQEITVFTFLCYLIGSNIGYKNKEKLLMMTMIGYFLYNMLLYTSKYPYIMAFYLMILFGYFIILTNKSKKNKKNENNGTTFSLMSHFRNIMP